MVHCRFPGLFRETPVYSSFFFIVKRKRGDCQMKKRYEKYLLSFTRTWSPGSIQEASLRLRILEVKDRRSFDRGLQGLQGRRHGAATPGAFPVRIHSDDAEGMMECPLNRSQNAVGSDLDGDVLQAGDQHCGQSSPVKLFNQRSPATRPCPSAGCEDHPGGPLIFCRGGHLPADPLHLLQSAAVATGT